jgi:NDP-sugar pyrophosphorylase family protein
MKAMLLCAGLGTRLRPLTLSIPKPLVPAPDRPLALHALDSLARAGADLVVINLHHLPEIIRATLGESYQGMRIAYSHEPEILGPTGGLRKALHFFGDTPFVVLNGDVYCDIDVEGLMEFHLRKDAELTIAAKTGAPESPFNALAFDADFRLRQLWDAPAWRGAPLSRGINIGAFVYSPGVVRRHVPPDVFHGFREDFIPNLFAADEKIFVYPCRGYWTDIGSEKSYLNFLKDILDGKTPGIAGGHAVSDKARIDPDAVIAPPCRIAAGCVVAARAEVGPYSVLGENAHIGAQAKISGCLIPPGARVAPRFQGNGFIYSL